MAKANGKKTKQKRDQAHYSLQMQHIWRRGRIIGSQKNLELLAKELEAPKLMMDRLAQLAQYLLMKEAELYKKELELRAQELALARAQDQKPVEQKEQSNG